MQVYDYSSIENVLIIGGGFKVHVLPQLLLTKNDNNGIARKLLKKQSTPTKQGIDNTLFIVCGGCQLEKETLDVVMEDLKELEALMENSNSYVHIVRGCDDDPSIYVKGSLPFKRVIPSEDFSIVKAKNYSILCVGGDVSINRDWKEKCKNLGGIPKYFPNEKTIFDEKALEECVKVGMPITTVVTSAPTSFIGEPYITMKKRQWLEGNEDVKKSISKQRYVMDMIYSYLCANDVEVSEWFCKSHTCNKKRRENGIDFISLNKYEFSNVTSAKNFIEDDLLVKTIGTYQAPNYINVHPQPNGVAAERDFEEDGYVNEEEEAVGYADGDRVYGYELDGVEELNVDARG